VLFSPACERNKGPILAVLRDWLPAGARVLEIGSGSGQHAGFFCQQIPDLCWQASERQDCLVDLQAQLAAVPSAGLAPGSRLRPGGLLLLYGPFHTGGVPTAASNAAFDAQLRRLDPAMGVRDALELQEQGRGFGLEPLADVALPANNRMLLFRAGP